MASFALTHQVPKVLCQHVRDFYPEQHFLVFLDNLFFDVRVAHCLLEIGFFDMSTARKNAKGVREEIFVTKDQGKRRKEKKKDTDDPEDDNGTEPPAKSVVTLLCNSPIAIIVD